MTAPDKAEWGTIWMGQKTTTQAEGWFPAEKDVNFTELSIFEPKVTFGTITKDSDDIISSYIMSDLSGGGQIDLLSGADQTRYRHAIAGTSAPGKITLPLYVQTLKPAGATGTSYPALQIGDIPYVIFGTKVYAWDEDTDTWGTGVTIGSPPIGKGTAFGGKVFLPFGTGGYVILDESAPGTPSPTTVAGVDLPALATDTDSPEVVDFEVWDHKLWALTTAGGLCWSFDGADDTWNWVYDTARAQFLQLDASRSPKRLTTYADNQGDPALYVIADGTAFIYDSVLVSLEPTNIQFAPHPDFGRAACVWHPGEDLKIAVGPLMVSYTSAGVVDPDAGLSRNDGMPHDKLGKIVDLEPAPDFLYALVGGTVATTTTLAYAAKFGAVGSGDGQLSTTIGQIAIDSSGNIYVADEGNNRVQKFNSAGTFQDKITGLTDVTGVAVDASGNIYTAASTGGLSTIRKYNSSLVQQWTVSPATGAYHIATDGTHVYFTQTTNDTIGKRLCSDGTLAAVLGSAGTGDGEFDTPQGIAYYGGDLFVVDQGNDRVQRITTSGTFVRKWGTAGTGNGQFGTALAIAANSTNGQIAVTDSTRDDIQLFSTSGVFQRVVGATGTSDGQFTSPAGIAFVPAGDKFWVSDAAASPRLERFDFSAVELSNSVPAVPSVHYHTGFGWHGAWELDDPDVTVTWANVTATNHDVDGFRLWWGCSDGNVYSMPLRRTFHNPRVGWQAGLDRFAATGYILSSRFNALMAGFLKKARRLVLFMDNATPTETVTVSYRVDVEDDNWIELGTASSVGKNILAFDVDGDGFAWGQPFNWIQFRFDLARGDDAYQTPVLEAAVLNFTKVPQQAKTFRFTIPFPKRAWKGIEGETIRDRLAALLGAETYIKLVHRGTTYGGQLAAEAGVEATGPNTIGGATVNFIEVRTTG